MPAIMPWDCALGRRIQCTCVPRPYGLLLHCLLLSASEPRSRCTFQRTSRLFPSCIPLPPRLRQHDR